MNADNSNEFDHYMINWIINIGEWIGGIIFDAHRGESYGKEIFLQRKQYTEMVGKGFLAYIVTMVFPIAYQLNFLLFEWTLRPFPDTFSFALLGTPPFFYSLYGVGAAVVSTLYSSIDIFDNFLTEGVEKGQKLALVHIGIFYAFIGGAFQSVNSVDVHFPPPADVMPAIVDVMYIVLNNSEYAIPYLVSGFTLCTVIIGCYYETRDKASYQTTLFDERF